MHLLILLLALTTSDIIAVSVPANGSLELALAPSGKADVERAGRVSRVKIEIDRLQPASSQGRGLNTYVVWTASPEGALENIGALDSENGKGRFEATTKFEQFGIFVTAEPHYMVDKPSSAVAFRNQNPSRTDVRRLTVPVSVGAYDYSKIQVPPQGTLPDIVVQSRAAFQIARESGTELLAESEFRQARVSMDALEEMLIRQVPPDLVDAAANETIRLSQRAIFAARERAAASALESSKNEAAALGRENDSIQTSIQQLSQQLTEQQAAADAQIRRLQNDLADANREGQRLTFEGAQTTERLRNAERSLAELQVKQQQFQNNLSFELLPNAFDAKKALTARGREALTRIIGVALFIPAGQVRIEGPFVTEAMETTVRNFLVAAGVWRERITLIRK